MSLKNSVTNIYRTVKKEIYLETLLDIQRKLINIDKQEQFYYDTLGLLGHVSGFDSVYLFQNHVNESGDLVTSQIIEWHSELSILKDVEFSSRQFKFENFPYKNGLSRWFKTLSAGRHVIGSMSGLPQDEFEILSCLNINSFFAVPLIVKEKFWGFVKFDNETEKTPLKPFEIKFINMAASVIAMAIESREIYDKVQTSHTQLQLLYSKKSKEFETLGRTKKTKAVAKNAPQNKLSQYESIYYQNLVKNIRDIIYTIDLSGNFKSVNHYAEILTGYSSGELLNLNFKDLLLPHYIPLFEKMLELTVSGTIKDTAYEVKLLDKSNKTLIIELSNHVVCEEGKPLEIFGIAHDITEKKTRDEKLKQAEETLYGVLNTSQDAIMAFKAIRAGNGKINDFECQLINSAAERLLGKKNSEMAGKMLLSQMPEDDFEGLFERYVKVVETGLPLYYEHLYEQHDDVKLWLRISATKLFDGVVITLSDVTYQKSSEKDLQEQLNFNEILLNSLPHPAFLLNKHKKILAVNHKAAELGIITDQNCWNIFNHGDNLIEFDAMLHDSNKCFFCYANNCIENMISADPQEVELLGKFWQMNLVHIYEDIFLYYAIDLTEIKNAKSAIETASIKTEKAEATKKNFLANMSHELRTPMNIILGFAELLNESSLSDEQVEYLKHIRKSGIALLSTINDIIDFSNAEAQKIEIYKHDFELSQLIEQIKPLILPDAEDKGLKFVINIDEDVPKTFFGDLKRINQVLLNLLNNAIKFSHKGTIRLNITHEIHSENESSPFIKFEVTDEGIGISQETLEELFSPFVQADGSLTRRYGGSGLGLTLSNHMIKLMGGKRLFVESTPGQGSTFFFILELLKK